MSRNNIKVLQDIPNVGKATEKDFHLLGITEPAQLIGSDPYELYDELCKLTGKKHDPCMIDVFISAVRFMEGGSSRKWWEFTEERKRKLGTE